MPDYARDAVMCVPGWASPSINRLEARARCRKVAMGLFLDGWLLKGAAREPDVRIAKLLRFVLQPSDDDRLAWKGLS